MNEEWIREQVAARDSLEDALAQSRRAAAFAVTMARTVGTLADAIDRVRELHKRHDDDPGGPPYCAECTSEYAPWPCPTIRALGGVS